MGRDMLLRSKYSNPLFLALLSMFLFFTFSCGEKEGYIGTYEVEVTDDTPERLEEAYIELKANGEGAWTIDDEEVPFRWAVKKGQLRLNTKEGGVIVGKLTDDVLEIQMPGAKTMTFKRAEE